jgi:dipeptidase E
MKLLLTSAGIKNASIHDALVEVLGKPIAESSALCIPTAGYGHPMGSPAGHGDSSPGGAHTDVRAGVEVLGSAGTHRAAQHRRRALGPLGSEADALLVNGGDAVYLGHWMRQSGLADLLPSLDETVWAGLSAGSMVMTPRVGEDFVESKPSITGDDITLGIVDFSIFPHLDHPDLPENTMAEAERWAAEIGGPAYAIDDETAITVVDGSVEVVSEGHWRFFAP